tara:strand:+ start:90 stop:356 length:267 start_codon:yes stop_codon:yes gene_type:complete
MAKNKAKATNITQEELEELQGRVRHINDLQMRIGNLILQQNDMVTNTMNAQEELNQFQKKLRDKYGDISVNINDGNIKYKEDETDKKN